VPNASAFDFKKISTCLLLEASSRSLAHNKTRSRLDSTSMARRSAFLALALALVALAAPWQSLSGVGPTVSLAVPMSRETEDSLPGLEDDPLVRKALKCNACHVLLDELLPALRMERAKKRRELNPDEFIRTTERTCGTARAEYGLQMRNNKVTPVYSKHAAVSRAEGSWISNYIATTCGQIIGDYDEALKEAAFGKLSANDLRATVCQRGKNKTGTRGGDDDDDEDADGLGVCPDDVDWRRVNTHDDGWSSTGETLEDEDVDVDEDQEL
jgi:hypothetical protein